MPRSEPSNRILALRPGRRELGIAILDHDELLAWKVANFRQTHLPVLLNDLKRRLHALIQFYRPTVMAMEQVSKKRRQSSPYLDAMTAILQVVALEATLDVRWYGVAAIRQHVCGADRGTGQEIVRRLLATYPELRRSADWTSAWQAAYWMPMFTAIAVGLVALRTPP